MDRIKILIEEKQSLITRLNNYNSLLHKEKSKHEITRINQGMKYLNEKIQSINLILVNLKGDY